MMDKKACPHEFLMRSSCFPQTFNNYDVIYCNSACLYYDLYGYDENTIINDIITQFEKYLRFVHTSPGTLPWDMSEHDELLNDSRTNK